MPSFDPEHLNKVSVDDLIERLRKGWREGNSLPAVEFVRQWKSRFHGEVNVRVVERNTMAFSCEFPDIYLRGMAEAPCLLGAGDDSDQLKVAARTFLHNYQNPRSLSFFLALTDAAYYNFVGLSREGRTIVLPPGTVAELLGGSVSSVVTATILEPASPQEILKRQMRQLIPRLSLVAYNTTLPASGAMFFGREDELRQLLRKQDASFAVAGPGRNGKTSLIKEYIFRVRRTDTARAMLIRSIDFLACSDHSEEGISQFINRHIDGLTRPGRQVIDVIRGLYNKMSAPLDLVLDEVDEVCQSEAFQQLGAAMRHEYCRLILSGRSNLLRLYRESPTSSKHGLRLDLLRLEPLGEKAARDLILLPLYDLGMIISEPERLVSAMCRWTGRQPQLIQRFSKLLVEYAEAAGSNEITVQNFEILKVDFGIAQSFIFPLLEMSDVEAQKIGLQLLEQHPANFTLPDLQRTAAEIGILIDSKRALEICDELVISHVVAWNGSNFALANSALPYYARNMGLFGMHKH